MKNYYFCKIYIWGVVYCLISFVQAVEWSNKDDLQRLVNLTTVSERLMRQKQWYATWSDTNGEDEYPLYAIEQVNGDINYFKQLEEEFFDYFINLLSLLDSNDAETLIREIGLHRLYHNSYLKVDDVAKLFNLNELFKPSIDFLIKGLKRVFECWYNCLKHHTEYWDSKRNCWHKEFLWLQDGVKRHLAEYDNILNCMQNLIQKPLESDSFSDEDERSCSNDEESYTISISANDLSGAAPNSPLDEREELRTSMKLQSLRPYAFQSMENVRGAALVLYPRYAELLSDDQRLSSIIYSIMNNDLSAIKRSLSQDISGNEQLNDKIFNKIVSYIIYARTVIYEYNQEVTPIYGEAGMSFHAFNYALQNLISPRCLEDYVNGDEIKAFLGLLKDMPLYKKKEFVQSVLTNFIALLSDIADYAPSSHERIGSKHYFIVLLDFFKMIKMFLIASGDQEEFNCFDQRVFLRLQLNMYLFKE